LIDPYKHFERPVSTFTGIEHGPDGRRHNVIRTTCVKCGTVISEMHHGCCGHGSCGFGTVAGVCGCRPAAPDDLEED
jgi:hypothetical protein